MPTKDQSDDNDDTNSSTHKKDKVVQPIHEDTLKKQLANDKDIAQTNADLLAELAAKTSALAETVGGREAPAARILEIKNSLLSQNESIYSSDDSPMDVPNVTESSTHQVTQDATPAVDLIRAKLNRLFGDEPDAEIEAVEAQASAERSKHQQFMYNLTTSGKSLAAIQTEWHEYYVALGNEEKHEVWQEFYKNQNAASAFNQKKSHDREVNRGNKHYSEKRHNQTNLSQKKTPERPKSIPGNIKTSVSNKVSANGRLSKKDHFKSVLFGLGLSSVFGLVIVFVFFNPVFIAPLVSPSKSVSATPIIGNVTTSIGPESKIIIPKINLEVPIIYGMGTVEESAIQNALEDGVVHYAASPESGEIGNSVIVGHSSNNILNSGKYKFAFVLLNRMDIGDTFFVHKDGVRYTYKIYETVTVPPDNVSVLGPAEKPNSITLITCDPPGTSINRLIVVAEQITPDPAGNQTAIIEVDTLEQSELPSDAPTFFSRLWPF
jgi:LPXTG-site transpeptidase (sortase) family protein